MLGKKKYRVKVSENGPYIVTGGLPLLKQIIEINDNNESIGWTEGQKYPDREQYALCRCGHSKNHPYCTLKLNLKAQKLQAGIVISSERRK